MNNKVCGVRCVVYSVAYSVLVFGGGNFTAELSDKPLGMHILIFLFIDLNREYCLSKDTGIKIPIMSH